MPKQTMLKLDDWEPSIPIIGYSVGVEIIDGQGTGRMQSEGWPLYREPYGSIINLDIEFGVTNSKNADFIKLFNKIIELGRKPFISVTFMLPVGELFTQNMYASPGALQSRRVSHNGVVYHGTWPIKFIAEKAQESYP